MINDELSVMVLLTQHGRTDGVEERNGKSWKEFAEETRETWSHSAWSIDRQSIDYDILAKLEQRGLIERYLDHHSEEQFRIARGD